MNNLTKGKRPSYFSLFSKEVGATVVTDWCSALFFEKMLDLCNAFSSSLSLVSMCSDFRIISSLILSTLETFLGGMTFFT